MGSEMCIRDSSIFSNVLIKIETSEVLTGLGELRVAGNRGPRAGAVRKERRAKLALPRRAARSNTARGEPSTVLPPLRSGDGADHGAESWSCGEEEDRRPLERTSPPPRSASSLGMPYTL